MPHDDGCTRRSARQMRIGVLASLGALTIAACSGGGGSTGTDTTLPEVSSVGPPDGAVEVAMGAVVTAVFSEPMDAGTLGASTFTLTDASQQPVAGTVTYEARTATFTPSARLPASMVYTAKIARSVKDLGGNSMLSDKVWSFRTGAALDSTPPTVLSTVPGDGATKVSVDGFVIVATFDEPMDASTLDPSTFTLRDASERPVVGAVACDGSTATFTPSSPLSQDTRYTATVTTGARDLAGNALATARSWTFTTGASSGSLDAGFGTHGVVVTSISGSNDWANAVVVEADGKIVVGGISNAGLGSFMARYGADGVLDPAFGSGGVQSLMVFVKALGLQADGKLLAAGGLYYGTLDFAVSRHDADGIPDAGFGTDGAVRIAVTGGNDLAHALAQQADGKIVIAGPAGSAGTAGTGSAVVRLLGDGSLDATFGSGGIAPSALTVSSVGVQPDGKVVVAGSVNSGPAQQFALARYNLDGTLDATFGSAGTVLGPVGSGSIAALVIQPDGRIVVAGASSAGSAQGYDFALARYDQSGSLDASFGNGGVVITDLGSESDTATSVAIQPDGKILAAGATYVEGFDVALVRYAPDGSLDRGFGTGGVIVTDLGSAWDGSFALALQPDGRIVVAGRTLGTTGYDVAVARYWP